jgi:hypothetical protein
MSNGIYIFILSFKLETMSLYLDLLVHCSLTEKDFKKVTDDTIKVRHCGRVYDYIKRNFPSIFDNLSAVKEDNRMWLIIENKS